MMYCLEMLVARLLQMEGVTVMVTEIIVIMLTFEKFKSLQLHLAGVAAKHF